MPLIRLENDDKKVSDTDLMITLNLYEITERRERV